MPEAHRQLLTQPAYAGRRPVSRAVTTISCAAAILIGFLNPLLCLLHCAFTPHDSALTSAQQYFLCDLGRDAASQMSEPLTAVWSAPQAIYQAFQPAASALIIVVIIVAFLGAPTSGVRTHIPLPEFPPPKTRHTLCPS